MRHQGRLRIFKAGQEPEPKRLESQDTDHQSELRGCVSGFAYLLLFFFFLNPVALDLQGASQSLTFNNLFLFVCVHYFKRKNMGFIRFPKR